MLKRKMLRDIKKNLSQFITIFLMIMIGVMAYSGIKAYMIGMTKTADKFYTENNLFDLSVMGRFDSSDLNLIKEINHVNDAELKLSLTATTDDEKTLHLNFIESNDISRFYIYDGEEFDANKKGVWLDSFYANENHIKVGDIILVKYDTMVLHEKVLGIINVPDHLYDVRDESELYPDRSQFGIAYMSINEIPEDFIKSMVMKELNINDEIVFSSFMPNFISKEYIPYNNIMVDVDDKANVNKVKNDIEDKIEHAKAIIKAEDTSSYIAYQGEIDEGKTYVGVFSGIFLFIALLSVITTMTRVIKNQRIQIGTLKALGFSNNKILFHYIGYGFWISVIGSIIGMLLGYFFIGTVFMNLQMEFFEIPNGHPVISYDSILVALFVIIAVCIIIYVTGLSILKECPAETLRTKIPKIKSRTLNITKKGLFNKLSFSSKWNIRDILRNKMRTLMGVAGVVGCCMLIVCALGMLDSMNFFVDLQFNRIYNFDYKLNLKADLDEEALNSLYDKYGFHTSKTLGIEIKKANAERVANNILVTDADDYVRFVDQNNKLIAGPNDDGIFVTYKLAETNNYKIGDIVVWHIYGDDNYYSSKIIGFNKDPQNQNISMTRKYLESLNIKYEPDSLYTNDDLSKVKEIENVEVIQDIESLKDGMQGMLSMMKTMLVLIIGIAVLLGGIIIYNLGILSYTEKEYQFATLKVLGFNDEQIKKIFVKQNNWIAIVSIIIGLPLGFYLTDFLFKNAIEEHYDFCAFITTRTYIISAFGTFATSYFVSKFLARKVKHIDMVSSLKADE